MPVTLRSNPHSSTPSSSDSSPGPALLAGAWQVRVLGALEARNGDVVVKHFVSHAIAALLARLALLPERTHPREELIELLWPGVELDVGRNRLRHALSSLKRLIEPPGVEPGSVLVADRQGVQLAPGSTRCDALDFERHVRERRFDEARALYRGELLPGFYDDWIQDERARLIALHDRLGSEARTIAVEPPRRAPTSEPTSWPAAAPALPTYLTSYFGREPERRQLAALIDECRLVTVSGAGGCGKTRLAVEVARAVAGFDCVAFAALAECQTAGQMTAQLRVALQLPKAGGDPFDEVVGLLRDQRALLVLDNFEQLVQRGGVAVVEALLARVPALHLLITSRRVLGLAGEHEFSLLPLPQPDPKAGVEDVARSPSVSMFVDRARSVRPDFQVTIRNHEALATLCCALEGLPLAIELAASRSRAFSPDDMHVALAQRFTLLARGGARGGGKGGARHDSLRAAIDWSWQLLDHAQQRFLLSLSVFRGGWSAVSAQSISDEPQAHALLEELTADSLLRSEVDAGGAMRFFMLEMIREFLHEQSQPGAMQRLRQRHRAHFLARGLALGQRSQAAARDDLPNFVEALQTAVDDGEPRLAMALGVALRGEWEQHGMSAQVHALLERALAQHAESNQAGSEALCVHAHLLLRSASLVAGESEAAQVHVSRALELAGTQPALRAAALLGQARQHWERTRASGEMRPLLEEALVLARRERAIETEAGVLSTMANLAFNDDDQPNEAIELFSQAQQLYEAAGIEHLANRMLFTKANCHAKKHRFGPAMTLLDESERRFLASGHIAALPELANVQGFAFAYMLRWHDAEMAFARCAVGAAKQQNRYMLGFGLWNIARPLAHQRQPEAAGLLLAFTCRFWTANFGALVASDLRYVEQVRRLIRVQVGAAALEQIWLRAEQMTLPAALEIVARSLASAS